jgi:acyl carrier protein
MSLAALERGQWLADYLAGKIKGKLLMESNEDLSLDANYFDLGLTSLQIEELKQELEAELDRSITPSVFFNYPTLQGLVAHLRDELLTDCFSIRSAAIEEKLMQDDQSPSLYEGDFWDGEDTTQYSDREMARAMLESLDLNE